MGEVINLTRFRKRRERESASAEAADQRARFGRTKEQKAKEQVTGASTLEAAAVEAAELAGKGGYKKDLERFGKAAWAALKEEDDTLKGNFDFGKAKTQFLTDPKGYLGIYIDKRLKGKATSLKIDASVVGASLAYALSEIV